MKAVDVSPRLIGHRLRVEADDMNIEGVLQDLAVLTTHTTDGTIAEPHATHTHLTGVILTIAGHELRLHGHETVTITGKTTQ